MAAEAPASAEAADAMKLYARFLKNQGRDAESKTIEANAVAVARILLPSQAPVRAGVLKVGAGVTPPRVAAKVEAQYSEEARYAKYEGTVVLQIEIRPDGSADNINVTKGLGLGLDDKAVEAIRKWRFNPATKDGSPVTVAAMIESNFRLL